MSLDLRYHPCVEQRALADSFNESLKVLLPFERLHGSFDESDTVWRQLQEIGLFTIGLSEDAGGSGLGAAEEALIAMELGRRLAGPAVLATMGATHANAITQLSGPERMGRTAAAYRHGKRIILVGDEQAGTVLLRDGANTALYRNPGIKTLIDSALWFGTLHEGLAPQSPIAEFDAMGLLRLYLIDAAALAGIAATALETAVAYASERRQFGRAIGGFQAVKHHCANMAIAARNARDQVGFASVAIDEGRDDAPLQVECALQAAGTAALRNAAINIQVHGGIGFSEEAMPHVMLKRAQVLIAVAGGLEASNERIADASVGSNAHRSHA